VPLDRGSDHPPPVVPKDIRPRTSDAPPGARRIRILAATAVAGVLLMVLRAGGWASSTRARCRDRGSQQQKTIALPAQRGALVDRNGYELAFDRLSDTVIATPYLVTDAQGRRCGSHRCLHMTESAVLAKLIVSGGYSVVAQA